MLNEISNKTLKKQQPLKSKESPYKGKQVIIKIIRFLKIRCKYLRRFVTCGNICANKILFSTFFVLSKKLINFVGRRRKYVRT